MRRIAAVFVCFLLLGTSLLSAQVVFSERNDSGVSSNGGDVSTPSIFISVTDSLTSKPLPGAAVFLTGTDTDTLKVVTDNMGLVPYAPNRFIKDTLFLRVSYLGYKTVLFKHPVSRPFLRISVKMQEDPEQLNTIIITDKAVAMVVRGDTTIYNASAFKTMKGESLRGLLKQLPGVEVKGNDVYADGKKIGRILVNGTTLFNRDIKSAMDMIMSEEVTKIKLYDQHDPDRLIEQDTLGRKEKVLDVATVNPKLIAQDVFLSLTAGAFTDKGVDGKADLLGGALGSFRRFEQQKPQYNITAEVDHNTNQNLQGSTSRPTEAAMTDILVSQAIPRKLNYVNLLRFNYESSETGSRTEDRYNPTALYNQRYVGTENFSRRGRLNAMYSGSISTRIKNDKLTFRLIGQYSRGTDYSSNWLNSSIDESSMITDVYSYNRSDQGSVSFFVAYDRFFRKRGRKLSVNSQYDMNFGGGDGWRRDTLSSSYAPQWIINDSGNRTHSPDISLAYIEPLSNKFFMTASYRLSADFSSTKRIATDHLTGLRDTLNTFDYSNRVIKNSASLIFRYSQARLDIRAGANFNNSSQLRIESFPEAFRFPIAFWHIAPYFDLEYNSSVLTAKVTYDETAITPSVEQLRGVIDDSSPLFLRAGNPELEQTVHRNAKVQLQLRDIALSAVWGLNADYTERSNYIANKTLFFSSDTELENYGYTAPASSQLLMPENVDGSRSLSTQLSCHFRSSKFNSSFWPSVSYTFNQTPYFTGEDLHGNDVHGLGLNFRYMSGFSKYIQLSIAYGGRVSRTYMDDIKRYDSMHHDITASINANFLKRLWVFASAGYWYDMTTMGYRNVSVPVSAQISYKFGKKDAIEIGIVMNDIANRNRSSSVSVMDEFVRYQYDRIFGRSLRLLFSYNFK